MRAWLVLGLVVTLTAAACGTTANPAGDAVGYVGCGGDGRLNLTTWPADVLAADASVRLHFLSAEPAVPLAAANTWTFAMEDGAGLPLDVSTVSAAAFMPDHGHPSSALPLVTQAQDGTWRISSLVFTMPGVWRVTLTVTRKDGSKVDVPVFVCAAG